MTKLNDLTTNQLRGILAIKEQIEALQGQVDSIIAGGGEIPIPSARVEATAPAKRKYRMTAAHKHKLIKALARARAIRWAKIKGTGAAKADKLAKTRKMSAAVKAKLRAIAKARWAKAKAEGKKGL